MDRPDHEKSLWECLSLDIKVLTASARRVIWQSGDVRKGNADEKDHYCRGSVNSIATLGCLGQLAVYSPDVVAQTDTSVATPTAEVTPAPAAPTATPGLDVPTPEDGAAVPNVTITVRFIDDVNGNHQEDPGEPPVRGCPGYAVRAPGTGFDLPPDVTSVYQLLDPARNLRTAAAVSDASGMAVLAAPPGRYFVLTDVGFCSPQGEEKAGKGSAVTFFAYSPSGAVVDLLPDPGDRARGNGKGIDLSSGGSVTVTIGIHWFSGEYEGIIPPLSGDGVLPTSGSGGEEEGGLGWMPGASLALLGLSGVLMAAWVVSGRVQKRRPEA